MKSSPSPSIEARVTLPDDWLKKLLPFHLAVDRSGEIVQCGEVLANFVGQENFQQHIFKVFELERPVHSETPASGAPEDWSTVETRRLWILKHRHSPLRIKGSWQILENHALLLANMWICSLEELAALGLSIADFPVHELAGDHLLLLQQQAASIKDMRELSQSLTNARDQAQSASRAKSSFLATMSHEIRTPMNGVIGLTEALRDTPLNSDQLDLLDTVRSSANHLMQIINDILDFSKVEAGELQLTPAPTDLHKLVAETAQICQPTARAKGVSTHLDLDADTPQWLRLDATRFRQVLMNLLSNAIKFTASGGDVRLTVAFRTPEIQVRISDTGVGIAAEDLEQIFQPFKQAEEGARRGASGTGLGLAICRHIVTQMDGELTVESQVEQGSTFAITFNADLCAAPESAHRDQLQHFQGRLLIVDDNPVNLKVAERLFEKAGCTTTTASSGKGAIACIAADREAFDLVFMDCHMPEMDGFEATRELRTLGVTLPIVALTADVLDEASANCLAAGMNSVLTKPLTIDSVNRTLAEYLPH